MSEKVVTSLATLENWVSRKIVEREELAQSQLERKELNRERRNEEDRKKLREKYIIDDQDIAYLEQKGGALEIFSKAGKILSSFFPEFFLIMPGPKTYLRTPQDTGIRDQINGMNDVHIELCWDTCEIGRLRKSWPESDIEVYDHSEGRQILCSIARQNGEMIGFSLNNHSKKETVTLDNTALAEKLTEFIGTAPRVRLPYKVGHSLKESKEL